MHTLWIIATMLCSRVYLMISISNIFMIISRYNMPTYWLEMDYYWFWKTTNNTLFHCHYHFHEMIKNIVTKNLLCWQHFVDTIISVYELFFLIIVIEAYNRPTNNLNTNKLKTNYYIAEIWLYDVSLSWSLCIKVPNDHSEVSSKSLGASGTCRKNLFRKIGTTVVTTWWQSTKNVNMHRYFQTKFWLKVLK